MHEVFLSDWSDHFFPASVTEAYRQHYFWTIIVVLIINCESKSVIYVIRSFYR